MQEGCPQREVWSNAFTTKLKYVLTHFLQWLKIRHQHIVGDENAEI